MRHSNRSRLVDEPVDLTTGSAGPASASASTTRRPVWRALAALAVVVAILAGAYLAPLPSIGRVREWSESVGPWFAPLFFAVNTIAVIGPIPRSAFTVMSGVLFGPLLGFTGSMIVAAIAAMVAFAVARRLGRVRVQGYLDTPTLRTVEERLERRGWLAVGSLRLIPVVPFSLVNYASGLSSVHPAPYLVASLLGSAPGTAAVVFLGDALVGEADPVLIAVSAGLFAIGVVGLIVDARVPVTARQSST